MSASVQVQLHGATCGAKVEFSTAVQAFADFLADECQRQEISNRPPGVTQLEIAANSVVRAKQVLDRYGTRARPATLDKVCLIGAPLGGSATGVLGSHLTSTPNIVLFGLAVFLTIFFVGYLGWRRLL